MSPTRRGRGPRPESATALRRERESEIIGWVLMAVRWAFPRFRYDQIMRLGWKMMLPVSLSNVVITAAVFLWAGRRASPGWASSSGSRSSSSSA